MGHGHPVAGPQGPRPALLARRLGRCGRSVTRRESRSARAWRRRCAGTRTTALVGAAATAPPPRAARRPRRAAAVPAGARDGGPGRSGPVRGGWSPGPAGCSAGIWSRPAGPPGRGRDRAVPRGSRRDRRRGRPRRARRPAGPLWWSTARPGPPSTMLRPARTRRSAVNGGGAANLAAACVAAGARLVQVSTDYVFAGEAAQPYAGGRAPGAAHRLRAHQAGRGAGRARTACPGRLRGADRPGCTGRTGRTSSAR